MRKLLLFTLATLAMSQTLFGYTLNSVAQNGARWRNFPVSFHLNTTDSGLADSAVIATINEDMKQWNDAVGFNVLEVGTVDHAVAAAGAMDVDGINAITFSTNFRTDSKGFDPQSAVAIAGQYGDGYSMTDAFVIFNAEYVAWDTETAQSSSPRSYRDDLPTIALHELGHTLGLGHTTVPGAVMLATRQTKLVRTLAQDDIDGAKFVTGDSSGSSQYGAGSAASAAGGCGSIAYAGTGGNGNGGNGTAGGNMAIMALPMLALLLIRKRALSFSRR